MVVFKKVFVLNLGTFIKYSGRIYNSIQVVHSRVCSWPYQQTLD